MDIHWIYGIGISDYRRHCRDGNSGNNIKIKGHMDDWKAQVAEKTFIGALALFGAWLVKKSRPAWKWGVKMSSIDSRVDKIELELSIERSSRIAALKAATDPVYIMNAEGDMIFANPAFMDMIGYNNAEDIYGKGYLMAIPAEDLERVEAISERLIDHPSSFEGKVRFQHKDGSIVNTIVRSELIKDKNGVLIERLGRIFILR